MGGKGENGGDGKDWSIECTKAFIEICYDRVKKKLLQGSTFKAAVWEDINNELTTIIGEKYVVGRIMGKFNRLRHEHREFSTLLARTGVTWDMESYKVNAPESVWEELIKNGKYYKKFKKLGFEYNYEILGEIFNATTVTGKLRHVSTKEPPTSDEEKELEESFLSKGMHVDSSVDIDDDDDNESRASNKRKKSIGSSSERRRKEDKNAKLDRLEFALQLWAESMSARNEISKAKAGKYKVKASQATSQLSDPYSIEACMDVLDSVEDVSTTVYNKVIAKFAQEEWRCIFIKMSEFRRKNWLYSLD